MNDSQDPKQSKKLPTGPSGESDITRVLNPATDTLKIDLELAKATDPVLILIRGTPQGKKYSLKGQKKFILGRDKSADIQLDDANVSRQHSLIFIEDERIYISDMGSRNGTFLNDESIGANKVELAKEDMIKMGSTILKYLPAGQLETLYHINITNAAHMDKLTGLFNRKYISEVLEVEFKRAKALHSNISVVLFDIDNFKKINDTYGHDCGDYVLSTLGAQVKASGLRERDLAGRYGGEEFIVVLANSNTQQASDVAERIRKKIENFGFEYEGTKIPVTVSLGVASIRKDFHLGSDIYKEADKALYESKRNGKNRVTVAPDQ
jgi:two-component system, cell cycle response regulator